MHPRLGKEKEEIICDTGVAALIGRQVIEEGARKV